MSDNIQKPTYHVHVMGCQMNEHDAEVLCGMLESMGFEAAESMENASLLVLVTCAVRGKAEEKAATLLGKLKSWKEGNPGRIIAVGGCMSQQQEMADYIRKKFRHVDIVFGTHSLPHFPDLLKDAYSRGETIVDIEEKESAREDLPIRRKKRFQAWVPIIYGCENYCSYCIVPYVRGAERSRALKNIVQEVTGLAREGYKEITLLGQNVNAYGRDLHTGENLASLFEALNGVDGIQRIRFLTSHPRDFHHEFIQAAARYEKVCEHFHLPLQSGSNRILKLMNRGYTREHYLSLVENIRELIPRASITTDLIAGFPGETEVDFEGTVDMMERVRFDAAFTFIYSPRRGTPAHQMPGEVSSDIKRNRIDGLIQRQKEIGLQINKTLAGKEVEVLAEGKSKGNAQKITGRTRSNKLVHFTGKSVGEGDLVTVKITDVQTWHLKGELVEEMVKNT